MRLLTLIFTLLFTLTGAYAYVGKVSAMKGDVRIQRGAEELKAFIGSNIEESDTIVTTATSRAQLYFKDDTVVSIGKNSTFKVEGFFFDGDPQNSANNATFSAVKGAFKVMTGQIGKVSPKSFKLSTRTATIGIRGTHFLGNIKPDADQIACTDGKISVATLDGQNEVIVNAGQITFVVPGEIPTPPRDFSVDELKSLSKAATNGDKQGAAKKTESKEKSSDASESEETAIDEIAEETAGVDEVLETVIEISQNEVQQSYLSAKPKLDYEYSWVFSYTDSSAYFDAQDYVSYYGGSYEDYYESVNDFIAWFDNIGDALAVAQEEYPDSNIIVYNAKLESLPDNNEYTQWGTWELGVAETYEGEVYGFNEKGYYLTGNVTPATTVQSYVGSNTQFTYNGSVIGSIQSYTYDEVTGDYSEEIAGDITNGSFNATVDFGAGTIQGNISFDTTNGDSWSADVDTSLTFSDSYFETPYSSYDSTNMTSTTLSGAFYGNDMEAVGGEFDIYNSDNGQYAVGVFEGKR